MSNSIKKTIKLKTCPICAHKKFSEFNPQSFFFPSSSSSEFFPNHINNICHNCGIIFLNPTPSDEKLTEYYNSNYRQSQYCIEYKNKIIDLPVQFPESAHSFLRFKNFLKCIEKLKTKDEVFNFNKSYRVLDLGGYQGMFLNAFSQMFGIKGTVADFNMEGINFAKNNFNFNDSFIIQSSENFNVKNKFNLVTMVHSLEHMRNPVSTLHHLKKNVLKNNGYIYIEVPNLFGSALSDPTHFFTFSTQSLKFVLNKSGFEVCDIFTSSNEHAPMIVNNEQLVIICMAKSSNKTFSDIEKINNLVIYKKLIKNYKYLSRKVLIKQVNKIFREFLKLLYYLIGYYLLILFFKNIRSGINKIKKIYDFKLH